MGRKKRTKRSHSNADRTSGADDHLSIERLVLTLGRSKSIIIGGAMILVGTFSLWCAQQFEHSYIWVRHLLEVVGHAFEIVGIFILGAGWLHFLSEKRVQDQLVARLDCRLAEIESNIANQHAAVIDNLKSVALNCRKLNIVSIFPSHSAFTSCHQLEDQVFSNRDCVICIGRTLALLATETTAMQKAVKTGVHFYFAVLNPEDQQNDKLIDLTGLHCEDLNHAALVARLSKLHTNVLIRQHSDCIPDTLFVVLRNTVDGLTCVDVTWVVGFGKSDNQKRVFCMQFKCGKVDDTSLANDDNVRRVIDIFRSADDGGLARDLAVRALTIWMYSTPLPSLVP
jgi:hypothetical protein